MDDYLWVLKRNELDLVREIEPERMAELDEDGLLALHKRVRRARNKHVNNYRRRGAKNVAAGGARGPAAVGGAKERHRAEAFEEALSRVSARLAFVAHEEAEKLKTERLERARAGRGTGPESSGSSDGAVSGPGRDREHRKSTGGLKKDKSSQAKGARRQAKRDAR